MNKQVAKNIILLDFGSDPDTFLSYYDLYRKLKDNKYIVRPLINKRNRCNLVTDEVIKYDSKIAKYKSAEFVKKTLWHTGCLNTDRYIIISEDTHVLNAFRGYKMNTCMLVRFSEDEYELYSTFYSPKFEKVKEKIKSN